MSENKKEKGCLSYLADYLMLLITVAIAGVFLSYVLANMIASGMTNPCAITLSDGCVAHKYEQCINSELFTVEQCKVISELGK